MDKNRLRDAARNNIVTIMFIVLCAVCMAFSGYAPNYVLYELFGRLSRNMFIVLSLIIPIVAGMGINFAITIGAMAAQIACLLVLEWGVPGIGGLALAVMGFAMGGGLHPESAAGIPVLLFLAFISGAGYVIWALLMKNNPVSRIAVFGLIIPVMNVLLSALLNGEPLFEWNYLAALLLVCIGIYLVNRAPQEAKA